MSGFCGCTFRFTHDVGIPISTQQEAATLLNVSRDSVAVACTVLNEGTPEEIAAVGRGEAAVPQPLQRAARMGKARVARKPAQSLNAAAMS